MKTNQTPLKTFLFFIFFTAVSSAIISGCGGSSPSTTAGSTTGGSSGTAGGSSGGSTGGTVDSSLNDGFGGLYFRWEIQKNGTTFSTIDLSSVTTPAGVGIQPNGDYVVTVYDGATLVDAYPFKFQSSFSVEGTDEAGNSFTVTTPLTDNQRASIWIRGDRHFDKLQVLNPAGEVVLETTQTSNQENLGDLAAIVLNETVSGFSHIHYLNSTNLDLLHSDIRLTVRELDNISDTQKALIASEFRKSSYRVTTGVSHIGVGRIDPAVYHLPSGYIIEAVTWGSFMILNRDAINRPSFPGTIIHEAAHAYTYLFEFPTSTITSMSWTAEARTAAQETMRRLGLTGDRNFVNLWTSVQNAGRARGLTNDYMGAGSLSLSPSTVSRLGFAIPYGAFDVKEDIATYVERVQGHEVRPEAALCVDLRAAGERLPITLSLAYIKLNVLKNAGFIDQAKYDRCIGSASHFTGERGIFLYTPDGTANSLTDNVNAGYDTTQEALNIYAAGADNYTALIQVKAPGRRPPLGFHVLDNISNDDLSTPGLNGFYLGHTDAGGRDTDLRSRTSYGGLVLVSEVTHNPDKVQGMIFFLELRNWTGAITDFFPYGTFRFEP